MSHLWHLVNSKAGYTHPFFKVQEDHVRLPDDSEIPDYTIWDNADVAQVVPVNKNGELLLVQQYKHGVENVMIEFPGGFLEPQEVPEAAAKRELAEETGYGSNSFKKLGTFIHHPSKERGKLHLFLAKDIQVTDSKHQPDATEFIELVFFKPKEILDLLQQGKVLQTGTMLGVLLYLKEQHGIICSFAN